MLVRAAHAVAAVTHSDGLSADAAELLVRVALCVARGGEAGATPRACVRGALNALPRLAPLVQLALDKAACTCT